MWRGFDVLDNREALQPSVTLSNNSGLNFNIWGSFGISDRFFTSEFDELDLTLNYGKSLTGILSASIGIINYNFPGYEGFPDKNSYSLEYFASASLSLPLISPHASIFYDTNLGDGIYVQAGFTHGLTFIPLLLKPEFSFDLAYNNGVWGLEEKGISHAESGIFLPVNFLNLSIGAGIYCTILLSDELKTLNDDKRIELWSKLSIQFNF